MVLHYWRTTDGQWHEQYIDDTSVDLSTVGIDPTRAGDILLNRGDLLFDDSDYEYRLTAVNSVGEADSTIVRVATDGSSNAAMD
ncbi:MULTISPECIES: hypothetical protein [unclassified Haloferax]|uniref:hypothetical protein n=1 Tax=Haloferax TaxID=2251 RepID=UPI0002B2555C|nr:MULTISPECIES: hypothetical protein [unclassified Haloferax]ELZ59067.1 cellulase [Haloferax sp. ATCC BAA-646]ELZ60358.1 cellulase [Haloferax sp. ATCC BAA-645]ELZ72331.1 cellulase [Haloferax sp. ATCC BAA-644]